LATSTLHPDCIDDCCWPTRIADAGGETPVHLEALAELADKGYLLSTDDGIELRFDMLPQVPRENLWIADDLRRDWLETSPDNYTPHSGRARTQLHSSPELGLAIEAAVELLGLSSVPAMRRWLEIPDHLFDEGWFVAARVRYLMRCGWDNRSIVEDSERWGLSKPLTINGVQQRRHRLRSNGVPIPPSVDRRRGVAA